MIKLEPSSDRLNEIRQKHLLYAKQYVLPELEQELAESVDHEQTYLRLIVDNFENLIVGSVRTTERYTVPTHNINAQYLLLTPPQKEKFERIFSYSKFTDQKNVDLCKTHRSLHDFLSFLKNLPQRTTIEKKRLIEQAAANCEERLPEDVKSEGILKALFKFIKSLPSDGVIINPRKEISTKLKSESKFPWGAYELVKALNVGTCPYCNRNYVSVLDRKKAKTRPELDHFYPKSIYPHLALALHNLIPSCHVCNSNLKGRTDPAPHSENCLNPYEDGFGENLLFSIDEVHAVEALIGTPSDIRIHLQPQKVAAPAAEKSKNSAKLFKLEELYSANHKDIAEELLWKKVIYSDQYIQELRDLSCGFLNDTDFKRLLLGNYTEIDTLGKRPLSKLVKDLNLQLDILK